MIKIFSVMAKCFMKMVLLIFLSNNGKTFTTQRTTCQIKPYSLSGNWKSALTLSYIVFLSALSL